MRAVGKSFFRYLLCGARMTAATTTKCMMYIRNWITILGQDMWKSGGHSFFFLLLITTKGDL